MSQPLSEFGQKGLALAAVVFGAVTIVAGARVLAGSDPGYAVFRPLLIYNTVVGGVYIGVGASGWRRLDHGRIGAAAVALLDLLVLTAIWILHSSSGSSGVVATESLRAMTLRTAVWGLFFAGFWWLDRRSPRADRQAE